MMRFAALIFTTLLAACADMPGSRCETYVAAASEIDQTIESATIEDYILALPSFEFHEEAVQEFTERVRNAREREIENSGKHRDFLFVSGDGSSHSKVFTLKRRLRRLTIRTLKPENGVPEDSMDDAKDFWWLVARKAPWIIRSTERAIILNLATTPAFGPSAQSIGQAAKCSLAWFADLAFGQYLERSSDIHS